MSSIRVHYLRRKSYNTRSNKIRKLRTPGGRLTVQYVGKRHSRPAPALRTNARLSGVTARPDRIRSKNRVSRPYGGVFTPGQLKERILRAFLTEEVKIVKRFVRAARTGAARPAGDKAAALKKPAQAKKAAPKK